MRTLKDISRIVAFSILYLLALPFAVLLFVWEYYTRKTYIDATIKKGSKHDRQQR